MNILADGFDFLRSQMQEHAGITVTYTRESDGTEVQVVAVQGNTTHVGEVQSGFQTTLRTDDFHIAVSDLVVLSVAHEPAAGDTISYERGGVVRTFRVTSPMGQGPYRLVDFDRAYRVHAILVEQS